MPSASMAVGSWPVSLRLRHVEAMQATVETDKVIKFSNDIHYVVEGVGKLGLWTERLLASFPLIN